MEDYSNFFLALSFLTQAILVYGILCRKKENTNLKEKMAADRKYVNEYIQRVETNNFNNLNEVRKEIIRLKKIDLVDIGAFVQIETKNVKFTYVPNGTYKIKDIQTYNMKDVYYVLEGGQTVHQNEVTPLKLCKKSSKKC